MAKILLIDDDAVLLKLYSTRMLSDHHQVKTAMNGEEGLRAVAQFKPDVIVLDLLMPKINGFTFIETLQQHPVYKHIHVIVFSSVASHEQIDRLTKLGITTFLNKTETTPTQLVSAINHYITTHTSSP
jgi:CheY-like chemotaxis protein